MADLQNCYTIRNLNDVHKIREALDKIPAIPKIVVIGGGYIGLEIAASLRKLNCEVDVLELADRVLARVTSPETSSYFHELHVKNGVNLHCNSQVTEFERMENKNLIKTSDGSSYEADMVIMGVGVQVNDELARHLDLKYDNGIVVNAHQQSSEPDIYAIGDCSNYFHPIYQRQVRLESVQNAVDQAKIAAANICGKELEYQSIPWFWSDQYDVKLQIAGLIDGYDEVLTRKESDEGKYSVWYFKGDQLLAVDAMNNPKAYMIGMKVIKEEKVIDKSKLTDTKVDLKPGNILALS